MFSKGANVQEEASRRQRYQGMWQVAKYRSGSSSGGGTRHKSHDEVWIFRDDDEDGIDPRVYENNPPQGRWGYAPSVQLKQVSKPAKYGRKVYSQRQPAGGASTVPPDQMWFFPPSVSEFPPNFQEMGDWIQPVYQRDTSMLSPGASGFFTLPSENSPGGTQGKWKVLGVGDQPVVVRRKKKAPVVATSSTPSKSNGATANRAVSKPNKVVAKKAAIPSTTPRATSSSGKLKPAAAVNKQPSGSPPKGSFQIHIRKQANGEVFSLQVQPGFKIGQCRQKLMKMRGIPMENIAFSMMDEIGGTETFEDDTKTLQALGVRNGDTLDLAPITVYVRTPKGKKIVLTNVDPEANVETLKELVEAKDGTPVSDQGLFFNRQPMQGDQSITKYKVKHKGIVELKSASAVPIVKKKVSLAPKTTKIPPVVATIEKKAASKKVVKVAKVAAKMPAPPSEPAPAPAPAPSPSKPTITEITLLSPVGKKVPIFLTPDDDLDDLKRKAARKVGIPLKHLSLLHDDETQNVVQEAYAPATGDTLRVAPIVSVRLPENKGTFKQSILPGQTICDVKAMLVDSTGVGVERQQLFTVGNDQEELDNDAVLRADTELQMRAKPIVVVKPIVPNKYITVQTLDGRILPMQMSPDMSHDDTRRFIAEKVGLPTKALRLFNGNEEELESSYEVSDGDVLKVGLPRVTVTMPDGEQIELEVEPDTTILDIKEILEEESNESKSTQRLHIVGQFNKDLNDSTLIDKDMDLQMQIVEEVPPPTVTATIKEPDGRVFYLELDPNDSANSFREKIAIEIGVSEDELCLCKRDVDLDRDFLPVDGDVISVKRPRIAVRTPAGTMLYLDERPGYTANDIQNKISDELHVPIDELRLYMDGEEVDAEYIPTHGDVIVVDAPSIVVDLPNGSLLSLSASPTTTIADVKKAIHADTGIDMGDQELFIVGGNKNEMENEAPLTRDTKLRLVTKKKPVSITVNTPDENSFMLVVEPDDTPQTLREKIAGKSGVSLAELRLVVDEDEADENFMPSDGDVLDVEPPAVTVALLDGTALELSAPPGTTVGDVKETLEEETGIAPEDQRLLLSDGDGDELEDDMPITNDVNLKLMKRRKISFTVVAPDETSFPVTIEGNDTPEEVREKISRKVGVPVTQLRLSMADEELAEDFVPSQGDTVMVDPPTVTVELPDGETLELEALPSTTVGDVKETIEEETGISFSQQWLLDLDSDAQILDDGHLIKADMNLKLEVPIEVLVKNLDGEDVPVAIEPYSTAKEVKNQISAKIGVPTKRLRLSLNGQDLDREYTPSKGDILTIVAPRINVELPDGSRTEIAVPPTHSIADLKQILDKENGIPRSSQEIFFFQSNTKLDDAVLFGRNDFVDGTILQVRLEKPTVLIETHDGKRFEMEFESSDTKNDVRYKIAREIGVPTQDLKLSIDGAQLDRKYKPASGHVLKAEAPQIQVELPDGSKIRVPLLQNQSTGELKNVLEKVSGIEPQKQRLFVLEGDEELEEDAEISSYGFDDSTILQVRTEEEPPEIDIKLPDGETFSMTVTPEMTIDQLQQQMTDKFGFPVGCIKQNGKSWEGLDGTTPLKELDIYVRRGDTLHVEPPNLVVALPSGDQMNIPVLPETTYKDVMDRVEALRPDIEAAKHSLHSADDLADLVDVDQVSSVDIERGVQIKSSTIEITVELPKGDIFRVGLFPSDTIDDVKDRIYELTTIPSSQQQLTLDGKPADGTRTLGDLGLCNGSCLTLEPMHIFIQHPNGDQQRLVVTPDYTVERVKELISIDTMFDVQDQYLSDTEDKSLENGMSLTDLNVRSGDVLTLGVFTISVLCWSGDVVALDGIGSKSTLGDVKDKLFEIKSVPKDKQKLSRGVQSLNNPTATLRECNISHKDVLMLENPDKVDAPTSPKKSNKSPFAFLQKASNLLSSPKKGEMASVPPRANEGQTEAKDIDEASVRDNNESSEDDNDLSDGESFPSSDEGEAESKTITIITPDIEAIELEIATDSTIAEIKEKISSQVGIAANELRLTRYGDTIEDDLVPASGDTFTVEAPTITVTLSNGSTLELAALPTTTIGDVKEYLEEETGTPQSKQQLSYLNGDGTVLLDNLPMKQDVDLKMEVISRKKHHGDNADVENADGETPAAPEYDEITVDETIVEEEDVDEDEAEEAETIDTSEDDGANISPTRKLETVKARQFKSNPIEVHVKDPAGVKHSFDLHPETTVEALKHKIPSHASISSNPEDQCILCGGKELDSDKTLEECGVTDGDVLTLERYYISIMHFMSAVLPLEDVSRSDTLGIVKTKLALQQSIPKEMQRLSIQGETLALHDDHKTLKDFGVKHRTILVLQEENGQDEHSTTNGRKKNDVASDALDALRRADKAAASASTGDGGSNNGDSKTAIALDDRIAKIRERAEARKRARAKANGGK